MKRVSVLLLSAVLVACGGGSGGGTPDATQVATVDNSPAVVVTAAAAASTPVSTKVVVTDPCSIPIYQYGEVPMPPSYLGAFPIPSPKQRIPANVTKSIAFDDNAIFWGGEYDIPVGSECKDQRLYSYNLIRQSLQRIKADGAERIHLYNSCIWDDFSKPEYACDTSGGPDDISVYFLDAAAEKFIVDEAKKLNLTIVYSWQFATNDRKNNTLDFNKISLVEFKKAMTIYHKLIVNQSKYANQIGIDVLQADLQSPWFGQATPTPGNPSYDPAFREVWLNEMYLIIDDIRAVYNGKIIVGDLSVNIDSKIASKVDALGITLFLGSPITAEENNNLTVDLLKAKYLSVIKDDYDNVSLQLNGSVNVPIIWRIEVLSKADQYTGMWFEPRCLGVAANVCTLFSVKADFSIQAIGIEAALEAVSEQSYFRNYEININGYWANDELTPRADGSAFPNFTAIIRNKPAEGIVRYWFGR